MSNTNKYGISRNIPEAVKREVRKNCGFGCVNCGSPIYDYEHWNPTFENLKTDHCANGIALCCPSCHRVKGGLISNEQYEENIKNPYAFREGRFETKWSPGKDLEIILGNVACENVTNIFSFNGEVVIGFVPSKEEGCPPLLRCIFHDRDGKPVFVIFDNQIIGNPSSWDFTSKSIAGGGWEWCARSGKGKVDLLLQILPPNKIFIQRLNFVLGFVALVARSNGCGIEVRESIKGEFKTKMFVDGGRCSPKEPKHGLFQINLGYKNGFSKPPVLDFSSKNMILDGCNAVKLG